MSAAVAGPSSFSGPNLNGASGRHGSTKQSKNRRKDRNEGHLDDEENMSEGSASSRSSKRASRDNRSDASVTSASENEDAEAGATGSSMRRWKGKGPATSAFRDLHPTIDIPIPPALCHNPLQAARELMDSLVMRYVPQLGGVLIGHEDITFHKSLGSIDGDGAYSIAPAGMTLRVWAPKIAMRLEGRIVLSTPSHVSLLIQDKFNASITSAHLPSVLEMARLKKEKGYRWHEFTEEEMNGADVNMEEEAETAEDGEGDEEAMVDGGAGSPDAGEKSTGYWVNVSTGERLGGEDGMVTFTVVGLTIANHMLSVHGSLLRRPFSVPAPTYVPSVAQFQRQTAQNRVTDASRRVRFQEQQANEDDESNAEEDEEDSKQSSKIAANVHSSPSVQTTDEPGGKEKKKRASKVGPRREWETSGSESETDGKREKKKRKKE